MFLEILVYWPLALLVLLPLAWIDRKFHTRLLPPLDGLMRWIGTL